MLTGQGNQARLQGFWSFVELVEQQGAVANALQQRGFIALGSAPEIAAIGIEQGAIDAHQWLPAVG